MNISKIKKNNGMTYIEIIVVLSIFAVMSSVAMFSYKDFQAKIDIKNLASDIALEIVNAQKSALAGLFPLSGAPSSTWKPSYGVYFNLITDKSFITFVDLANPGFFDGTDCTGECLKKISITKGNFISNLDVFYQSSPSTPVSIPNLTFSFTRPDSGAKLASGALLLSNVSYVGITVKSPQEATAMIKFYPSGRIEVK